MIKAKEIFNTENGQVFVSKEYLQHQAKGLINGFYSDLCVCWGEKEKTEQIINDFESVCATLVFLEIFTLEEVEKFGDTATSIIESKIKASVYSFE